MFHVVDLLPFAPQSLKGRPSQKGKHTHVVQHFRYIRWPDGGVPSSCQGVLNLVSQVEKSQQCCGDAPIVVQCRYMVEFLKLWCMFNRALKHKEHVGC